MVKKTSSYTETEKQVYSELSANLIYGFMLAALRSKDKGSAFYIQEIIAQTEPEKICKEIADIAGKICSEVFHNKMSDKKLEKMYSYATQEGWKIHKKEKTVTDSVRSFR